MPEKPPLDVNQTHDLLLKAVGMIRGKKGASDLAETTLRAAQLTLSALAFGMLTSHEKKQSDNDAIISPERPPEP
ncbi:hypothetical protein [Shinella sp.]|uniref:hypothetical protein n=1 Tax=Shinella sp. TaxID=1870904 RepID=UPI0029B70802|nr:hypothetical protein [Shinella sp.]MDX3973294.1 hypothetical protein [Shinella sp.]